MKEFKPLTSKGDAAMFKGDVYVTALLNGTEPSKLSVVLVHFMPGGHTAWHSHAAGQYLNVIEGSGLLQERGGEVRALKAGDTVYTEPHVEHWHGAAPDSFMAHYAMMEEPDIEWLEHVSDEEYKAKPSA